MEDIPDETWQAWKRKRRLTFIGSMLVGILVGMDNSIVPSTLFLYLKDMVKTDEPGKYFSIAIGSCFVSATLSGAVVGRWLDRTRKFSVFIKIILLMEIAGFAIYTVPLHPLFPVFGRLICGVCQPFPSMVTGEVLRIYNGKEGTRALTCLGAIYPLGFVVGSVVIFATKNLNFKIGSFTITSLNFVGFFMIGCLLVSALATHFLVHDCSAEIDLKQLLERKKLLEGCEINEKQSDDAIDETQCNSVGMETVNSNGNKNSEFKRVSEKQVPIRIVLKRLCSNADSLLVFLTTITFVYVLFSTSILKPVILTEILKWGLKEISIVFIAKGLFDLVCFLFAWKLFVSGRSIYMGIIGCIGLQAITLGGIICLKVVERNTATDITLIAVTTICESMSWWFEYAFIRSVLAKMVPSKIQGFTEGLRSGVVKLALILGSFTASSIFPHLQWWSVGMMIVIIVLLLGFIARKKHLIAPQQISFSFQGKDEEEEKEKETKREEEWDREKLTSF